MSKQINLINPALRKKRDMVTATPLAIAIVILVVVVSLLAVLAKSQADKRQYEADQSEANLKTAQDQLMVLSKTLAESKPDAKLAEELANSQAMLKMREEIMAMLESGALSNSTGFADYLRGLARQVPGGLWLTGFTIGSGGGEMEIHGRVLNPDELPYYIRRLNVEKTFQGHTFSSLEMQRPPPQEPAAVVASKPEDKAEGKAKSAPAPLPSFVEFTLISSGPGSGYGSGEAKPAVPATAYVSHSSLEAIPTASTASTPTATNKPGAAESAPRPAEKKP